MLGSNSKANDNNCFPVCPHSDEKWDCFQGGKKEASCNLERMHICKPRWYPAPHSGGTWHENSDWPTYSAQELFFVHPRLRKAWKWRKYLEGKCSLNDFGVFFLTLKILYSFIWLDKNEGIKIFFFSVLPPFPFSKSACHYLNFEMGFSSSWGEFFQWFMWNHNQVIFQRLPQKSLLNTANNDGGNEMEPRKHLLSTVFF